MKDADDALARLRDPQRRRIYLMRHGAVSYFDQDHQPIEVGEVPLNDEGQRQAKQASSLLHEIPLDRVIASPLARCQETARLALGDRGLEIESHDDLREIEPGPMSALSQLPLPDAFVRAFHDDVNQADQFLGGETFGSLLGRTGRWITEITSDHSWRHLLVVAHGGTNRALLSWAFGSGLSVFGRIEQDTACLNVIDVNPEGQPLVRLLNFTPYNHAKLGIEHTTMERLFLEYLDGPGS